MRHKGINHIFSVILTINLLALSVLSGCSKPDVHSYDDAQQNEKSSTEIGGIDPAKIIYLSGWLKKETTDNLMAFLAEKYPDYSFEYKYYGKQSYELVTDAQLSSKIASDIVMIDNTMIKKYANAGYIVDLNEYKDVFKEKAVSTFSYGDHMYAIPSTSDVQCAYYNKEILLESREKLPVSFDEYIEFYKDIYEKKGVRPMSAALKDWENSANLAMIFLSNSYFETERGKNFGKRLAYGNASFTEEIYPYLMEWEKLIINGIMTKEMCLMDDEAAMQEFASGRTFMFVGTFENYNRIKEINPNIKLGTTPLYTVSGSKPSLIGGCRNGFAVNAYSKKKDVAIEIVGLLATEEGQKALWADRMGSQTYMKGEIFNNPPDFDGIKPLVMVDSLYMPWTEWGEYSGEIYKRFGEELQKVVLKEKGIKNAMKSVDAEIKHIYSGN